MLTIKKEIAMSRTTQEKWLVVFYSVPSRPVSNRMTLWRKLAKAGAVQLKGAVYILPFSEEHYELCQWLMSQVSSMRGDGAFVRVNKIETMSDADVRELFKQHRDADYRKIEKQLDDLERKISGVRKGARPQAADKFTELIRKLSRGHQEIHRIDFFLSAAGAALQKRLKTVEGEIKTISGSELRTKPVDIPSHRAFDFSGKTWVTRKKPFVDRMASAWLIRKFIDPKATFRFAPRPTTPHR